MTNDHTNILPTALSEDELADYFGVDSLDDIKEGLYDEYLDYCNRQAAED